nr:6-hydroxymethylpterin diphosphokinase MptE-like protein [Colwellia sp. E2M01]
MPTLDDKVSFPFIALPAELSLAEDDSSPLRDRICLALDHPFIEAKKGIKNEDILQAINNNIPFIERDNNVSDLFLTGNNKQYIVCGAGPTLEDHYQLLTQQNIRQQYILIAVDAAVLPLLNQGITPDIIVSIDPIAKKLFDDIDMGILKNIPLIYFPVVKPSLLSRWQGPRYTAYSTSKLYHDINNKHAKGRLYCGGSVIHPAIDLAVKMGAKNITFLGADFSFPGGKTHTHWVEDKSTKAAHVSSEKSPYWVLNSLNERVPTLLNYRGYLRDLEDYIALVTHVTFYNGSQRGALIKGTQLWPLVSSK